MIYIKSEDYRKFIETHTLLPVLRDKYETMYDLFRNETFFVDGEVTDLTKEYLTYICTILSSKQYRIKIVAKDGYTMGKNPSINNTSNVMVLRDDNSPQEYVYDIECHGIEIHTDNCAVFRNVRGRRVTDIFFHSHCRKKPIENFNI